MLSWARSERWSARQNKRERVVQKKIYWVSKSLHLTLCQCMRTPPLSICGAQSNLTSYWVEVSGSPVSSSSSDVSPNNQRVSDIKDYSGVCYPNTLEYRGNSSGWKVVPVPSGLSASPHGPTMASCLGSFSTFTSTSSYFKSFFTCSTSYEKK